jgi:radical S-adenosyl methionine domain-containing protein 2
MRCKFCFATYDSLLPDDFRGGLCVSRAKDLISALRCAGFRKITFAGGEPTLCPWLASIVQHAKEIGLQTAMVSNASRLTSGLTAALAPNLDWLTVSIDSASGVVNLAHGRAVAGTRVMEFERVIRVMRFFKAAGVRLKVNTVVTSLNCDENLLPVIEQVNPEALEDYARTEDCWGE